MKKIFVAAFLFLTINLFAQNDKSTGFKKENIFIGGGPTLGLGTGYFAIGATPEIGYSVNQWLDAGLGFNIYYSSQRQLDIYNAVVAKYSSFNLGLGPFVRIYPVNNFFLEGRLENNFISYKQKYLYPISESKQNVNATSLLAGIGYGQRNIGGSGFYTVIMIDLLTDPRSPYRLTSADGASSTVIPVVRGGFFIYLKPKKK